MSTRLPTLAAALSIAGLLGWIAVAGPDRSTPAPDRRTASPVGGLQERPAGSEVPCAVPLAWRVARVDPEFGLSTEAATALLREAGRLWEDGSGRDLFLHDQEDGFPVRLVYDDRQERLDARQMREGALAELHREITARRTELMESNALVTAAVADHTARMEDLNRRVSSHNDSVRAWNQGADRTPERSAALEAAGEGLARERERLEAERAELDAESASLRARERELNERTRELERRTGELTAAFPTVGVEAGEYREALTQEDGRLVAVSREIRLYRFAGSDELRLLAAHELGHALGLGHSADPAGVMHASARADRPVDALAASDVELLTAVCPEGAGR